jgi:hypothetical protein
MPRRSRTLRRLLDNPRIRSLELAFSGFNMAEYGVWVSVLVYAYEHGGVDVTAVVAVAQLLPAGFLAPLLARSVERWGAGPALRTGYWLQSGALAATAGFMLGDVPQLLVYAPAIVAASAVTLTRPAQAALVPGLVKDVGELTAINVLSGWAEAVSILAGPALAGVLIGVGGPGLAISGFALCMAISALLARGAGRGEDAIAPPADAPAALMNGAGASSHSRFTGLVALLGAQYLVIGMLDVLLVVFAISILRLGASGAGYLNAAFGAGGVLGSATAVSLIGRTRLVRPLLCAAVGWSLLLVALGAWPTVLGAFLLLTAAGVTRSLLDVSGRTILLDAAPPAMRSRVFGLLEGVAMLALAVGSLLVPILIDLGGARAALVAAGTLLSAVTVAVFAHLHDLDELGLSAASAYRSIPASAQVLQNAD